MNSDLFISHASEDKEKVARPLAEKFKERGIKVWYDEYNLKVGDSLRREIEKGLANCRYGVVILSPKFFEKEWPQKELDGLVAREIDGNKFILPIWHGIDSEYLRKHAPMLADKVGISTSKGLDSVVLQILDVLGRPGEPGVKDFISMPGSDFLAENEKEWLGVQKSIFPSTVPTQAIWESKYDIIDLLTNLARPNLLHGYLARGGGHDLSGAKESYEDGLTEVVLGESSYLCKIKALHLETFTDMKNMSYLRIVVDEIGPTGKSGSIRENVEVLTELYPLEYADVDLFERNSFENGEDLPQSARRVFRILKGDVCIFSKSSIYNQISSTYDGRHAKMNPREFRLYVKDLINIYQKLMKKSA